MTLNIGQLHLITVYKTVFGVYAVLVWSVILCSFFLIIIVIIIGILMAIRLILDHTFRLSVTK